MSRNETTCAIHSGTAPSNSFLVVFPIHCTEAYTLSTDIFFSTLHQTILTINDIMHMSYFDSLVSSTKLESFGSTLHQEKGYLPAESISSS